MIYLLGECQTKMNTYKIKKDMNTLLNKKYNVETCKSETELCDINHKKLISDDCKINKFINDRFVRE